ncbi:MAG: glycosyltransferase family 1 protein [Phycisphaerae bacterium]|nr:glycosyltransferase family 1 protein [Phycisphaerae bacterium]
MRVALFTDTLGDVNGVCRFLRTLAHHAHAGGRSLAILTSTRMDTAGIPGVHNVPPRLAASLPRYPQLQVALPPVRRLWSLVRSLRPEAVHVSTPGPIGLVGRWAARRLGVPMLATYHTDFPAYAARLYGADAAGDAALAVARWFYAPFDRVLSRSAAFAPRLRELGLPPSRLGVLPIGIDLSAFSPRHADERVWAALGLADRAIVRVLCCGRVSVEKNLPLLADLWPAVRARAAAAGTDARLVVVGDGPYLPAMRRRLSGQGVVFTGFRHGDELAALYAGADLLAFPSTTDTLGQAVLEAQASGVPAVVSASGGPAGIVIDGRTGLVVRREADWPAALLALILDPARRHAMSAAAVAHAGAFGFDALCDAFWGEHAAAVGARRPAPPGGPIAEIKPSGALRSVVAAGGRAREHA